jgi:DNA-binding NtrC family response regulator
MAERVKSVLWISDAAIPVSEDYYRIHLVTAADIPTALEQLRDHPMDAILLNLPMAAVPASHAILQLKEAKRAVPLVVHDPTGTADRTEEMERAGVSQYVTRPATPEELCGILIATIERNDRSTSRPETAEAWSTGLIGSSRAMRHVVEIIRLVSPRRSTVLITGETGSGKEVAARAIHAASNRSGSRLVAVNCAALPDHLLEAELFGHTKGAFTGAVNARVGLFEQAHHGTIFLDEIGEMPLQLQSKLLRVLQEREIQRIGSSEPLPVDVRVIAASNQSLLEAVQQRRFREDLYYRLNVVALQMPALRDRKADIPELAAHFVNNIAEQEGALPKQISTEGMEVLMQYDWPGNVRQLEHALESAVALSGDRMILRPADFDLPAQSPTTGMGSLFSLDVPESGINFEELINSIERRLLERALAKSGGNKARAANMLHMKRTTLISKFKSFEVCA